MFEFSSRRARMGAALLTTAAALAVPSLASAATTVVVHPLSVVEGDQVGKETPADVQITVTCAPDDPSVTECHVQFMPPFGGTATIGDDFTGGGGFTTVTAGQTRTVTEHVRIWGDLLKEPDETVIITAFVQEVDAANKVVHRTPDVTGTLTIVDDDRAKGAVGPFGDRHTEVEGRAHDIARAGATSALAEVEVTTGLSADAGVSSQAPGTADADRPIALTSDGGVRPDIGVDDVLADAGTEFTCHVC